MTSLIQPFAINQCLPHILPPDAAFDGALTTFTNRPKPSPNTVTRTAKFKAFLQTYTQQSKKPGVQGFRIGQHTTIAEVLDEANAAREAYEEQGSSLKKHFLRTAVRSVSDNASAVEVVLQFLPNGEYTSIICGALALVFGVRLFRHSFTDPLDDTLQAAKRLKAVRGLVLNCLGSLTASVENTKAFMQIYAGDRKLWQTAEELYIALLDAVESILGWVDESAFKHALGALFKQESYAKPMEAKIKALVEDKVKSFHEHLEYCQHERIQSIHIGVDQVIVDIAAVQTDVSAIRTKQVQQEFLIGHFMSNLESLYKDREWDLRRENQQLRQALLELAVQRPQQQIVYTVVRQPLIHASQLASLLPIDHAQVANDHRVSMQYGSCLPPRQQGRAADLLRHPRFQRWLQSKESAIMVVNGKRPADSFGTTSPLTYFTALLAQSLASSQIAVPLAFLCGLHSSPDDPLRGASGVLRSFILQILSQYGDRLDLSFMDHARIEATRLGDAHCLCAVFRELLIAVATCNGPTAIVCMIDGASFLETEMRKANFELMVASIQQLVLDLNIVGGYLILKVILTFPNISRFAGEWFPPYAILNMDERSLADGHGYDTARMAGLYQSALQAPGLDALSTGSALQTFHGPRETSTQYTD